MTRRVVVPALAFAFSVFVCAAAYGQAQPAAPAAPAPAAQAKWIPPIKGVATIEVIRGKPARKGNEIVTILKIKNTSKGPIALLGVDEYWYNQKREVVSGDSEKVKRLINPGEIVEVTMSSPWKEGLYTNQYVFNHANGKIDAKAVQKFQ
ncbi:MAG TPA: hypothetical protein VD833_17495 [Vicinamibacterales bacterium]|nr:hypothetical protein [Vicinamibacterales bacterium]